MQPTKPIRAAMALAAMFFLLYSTVADAADKAAVKEKVAVVNGVAISGLDFQRTLDRFTDSVARKGRKIPEAQLAKVKKEILDTLIAQELLFQESVKQGIAIDAQKVTEQLDAIKKRFADQKEFEKALARDHLTETGLRSEIEKGMAIMELVQQQVTGKITISDDEAKAFYDRNPKLFQQPEQVRARHILIKVNPKATEAQDKEARRQIEDIQKKLKDGGDFAALAKEFSQGPSSVRGGDLGYFSRGQMVKPFEDAAFALKPHQVSGVVKTRFGYHLIKVEDKKPARTIAFAEVKDRIKKHLKQQKEQKEYRTYLKELKKKAKIEKLM